MNKNDRVKRSSHEFELQYTIYNEPHKDTIQIDFYDEDTLCVVLDDYIDDFISDAFQDVIADAVAEGVASMNANGIYEISEVASNVYSSAYSYLEDRAKEFSLVVLDDYSDEQDTKRLPIDILAKLKAKLEDRETCECWDVDVGWAISRDAIDFQTEGVWHYGLASATGILRKPEEWPSPKQRNGSTVWEIDDEVFTPTMWFGREGDPPMSRWTITPTISQDAFHLWFLDFNEDIMDSIVDDFNTIAVWYLYECDIDVPDLSMIIGSCPIPFEETDDSQRIGEKLATFFSYLKAGASE